MLGAGVRSRGFAAPPQDGRQAVRAAAGPAARWAALIAAWLLGTTALAEDPSRHVSVVYEAITTCPDRASFVERMRARLRVDRTRVSQDVSLHVKLAAHGPGIRGSVEVARGAAQTARSIEGADCDEVVEALALVAALALAEPAESAAIEVHKHARRHRRNVSARPVPRGANAQRAHRAGRRSEARTGKAAPETVVAGRVATGTSTAAGAPDAIKPDPRPTTPDVHAPQSRARAPDSRATVRDSSSLDTAQPTPPAAPRSSAFDAPPNAQPAASRVAAPDSSASDATARRPSALRANGASARTQSAPVESGFVLQAWRVSADILAISGMAPAIQPGLQLTVGFGVATGELGWRIELGGRIAREDRLRSPDGDAAFAFTGGVLRACLAGTLGSARLVLSSCAVAEPGLFSAAGRQTQHPRSHSRLWLAAGAGAEASWRLTTWLNLRAGGELLAPVRRDRMLLAGNTIYRIPALGLRLHLGLEIPFG